MGMREGKTLISRFLAHNRRFLQIAVHHDQLITCPLESTRTLSLFPPSISPCHNRKNEPFLTCPLAVRPPPHNTVPHTFACESSAQRAKWPSSAPLRAYPGKERSPISCFRPWPPLLARGTFRGCSPQSPVGTC
jgi:hypothetical protein